MGQGHAHAARGVSGGRLAGAAIGNVGFAVVQVVVGLAIASVAVLADAAHQVVDAIGLVTAVGSVWLVRRPAGERSTFGLGRADALGALLSSLLLLASVAWIAVEAVERLREPAEVAGVPVIVIGLVAVAVNAGSMWLVGHDGDHLSLQAARLHLLTDLGGSVVVVLTGVVLANTSLLWVDPAASLLLCVAVLASTMTLLRRSVSVLLDRSPPEMELQAVVTTLSHDVDVTDVHHLHVRDLGAGRTSVTAHLIVDRNLDVHATQLLVERSSELLRDRFGVDHVTLQVECHTCTDTTHD